MPFQPTEMNASSSMVDKKYDFIEVAYPGNTTEVYTYKYNDTVVSTITIEYTNPQKDFISTVTKS